MNFQKIKATHTARAAVMSSKALDQMVEHLERRRAQQDTPELMIEWGCYQMEIIERRNREHPNYNGWHEDVTYDDESLADYHDRMRRRDAAYQREVRLNNAKDMGW